MITSKMKKILCVSLSAALVASSTSLGQLSAIAAPSNAASSASNAAVSKAINQGADLLKGQQASKLYFGNLEQTAKDRTQTNPDLLEFDSAEPVLWRVLENNTEDDNLLLISDRELGSIQMLASNTDAYQYSVDLSRTYYNSSDFYARIFSQVSAEQSLLKPVTIDDAAEGAIPDLQDGDSGYDAASAQNHATLGPAVDNVYFIKPSYMDVNNTAYGFQNTIESRSTADSAKVFEMSDYARVEWDKNGWNISRAGDPEKFTTRTPGSKSLVANYYGDGEGQHKWDDELKETNMAYGISGVGTAEPRYSASSKPGMGGDVLMTNLDSSQILLISSPTAKPEMSAPATGIQMTSNYTGANNWKLTIHDPSMDGTVEAPFTASIDNSGVVKGGNITVSYANATEYSQISAAIVDEAGTVLAYGTLTDELDGELSGSATLTLPGGRDGISAGNYTLYIYDEMMNGQGKTDCSSNPVTFDITVENSSSDATLSNMAYTVGSTGAKDNVQIEAGKFDYTVDLAGGALDDTITLEPTTTKAAAKVSYADGSNEIKLANGTGSKTLTVTASNETTTQNYTFTFNTSKPEEDASLKSLRYSIDDSTSLPVPDFAPATLEYTVPAFDGDTVRPDAKLLLDPSPTQVGAIVDTTAVTLTDNAAQATVEVTAPNKVNKQVYTVNFSRTPSADNTLATLKYRLPDTTEWVDVDPTDIPAEIKLGSHAVEPGDIIEIDATTTSAYAGLDITNAEVREDDTGVTGQGSVKVTAEDGTEATFNLNFSTGECEISTLNDIKYTVDSGEQQSVAGFDKDVKEYNIELPAETSETASITLEAVKGDDHETVEYSAQTFNLVDGASTQTITVTAEAGASFVTTYTLNFTRAKSSNNKLESASYTVQGQPEAVEIENFNPELDENTVILPDTVARDATITVSGTKGESHQAIDESQATVTLVDGKGTAQLTVTAEDQSQRVYKFKFVVNPSNNANLTALEYSVDGGAFTAVADFAPDKTQYDTIILPVGTSKTGTVSFKCTTENQYADVKADDITLTGSDVVDATITVTAEDNQTTKEYKLSFRTMSDNANLADLKYEIDGTQYAITDFDPATSQYNVSLPPETSKTAAIALVGTPQDSYSTVATDAIQLVDGVGEAELTVTAEAGQTTTYTVNFTREKYTEATISELEYSIDGGTPYTQTLEPGKTVYDITLPYDTNPNGTIVLTPISDTYSTVVENHDVTLVNGKGSTTIVMASEAASSDGQNGGLRAGETTTYTFNFTVAEAPAPTPEPTPEPAPQPTPSEEGESTFSPASAATTGTSSSPVTGDAAGLGLAVLALAGTAAVLLKKKRK